MKRIYKYILIGAFAVGLIGTACENNDLNVNAGTFPETGGIGLSIGMLQSDNYARESPLIDIDHQSSGDEFHIKLTEPALQAKEYTVEIDESKVADFNAKHGTSYPLYPTNFVALGNNRKMTVEKGKLQSNSVSIDFTYDESIEESVIYVLPLTVVENSNSPSISEERSTLYYLVNVWGMAPAEYDATEKNFVQIAGVDPEFTNPLLLNKLYIETSRVPVYYFNPFDIVNLQYATVKADDNHLPSIYLKDDLAYVLEKRQKYIVPLQQLNHKVCLAIKGGKEGIGFANLGDKEMDIFIKRIIQIINLYQLDGVNLYDIDFSYNKSENNFDYSTYLCKFVSSLREELGNKIITYTQTAESPEGISDTEAALKLGELVDYAWTDQLNTVVDPWGAPTTDWIKPIAGLAKEKWAALNSDIHMANDDVRNLTQAIGPRGSIMNAGLNHVFVINRVEYTTVGLETNAVQYMIWGGKCNLRAEYKNVGIGSPNGNQHLSIHDPLMPKDY